MQNKKANMPYYSFNEDNFNRILENCILTKLEETRIIDEETNFKYWNSGLPLIATNKDICYYDYDLNDFIAKEWISFVNETLNTNLEYDSRFLDDVVFTFTEKDKVIALLWVIKEGDEESIYNANLEGDVDVENLFWEAIYNSMCVSHKTDDFLEMVEKEIYANYEQFVKLFDNEGKEI